MIVYVYNEEDWIDFVNGRAVVVSRNNINNHYKKIIVSPIEITDISLNTVTVIKKY